MRRPEKVKRNFEMYNLRKKGWTLQKIGEKYKITRERVRQIVSRIACRIKNNKEGHYE